MDAAWSSPASSQPGAVEGKKIYFTFPQGGQAAAVDGGVAVQQQIAQLGHGGKDGKTGIRECAVLHTEIDHAFMPG